MSLAGPDAYDGRMKIANENKLRLAFRMLCKAAKSLGFELEQVLEMVEQEWERA